MKMGSSITMPFGMAFKKHFCHKCGRKLDRNANTRIITRKDPEWKKHSRIGSTTFLPIGEIEVTDYNSYICPECRQIIEYDKQVVIAKIQKKLGKNILTDDEIQANWDETFARVEKTKKIIKITEKALIIVIIAIILYFSIKSK